jgi:hypothetical protein
MANFGDNVLDANEVEFEEPVEWVQLTAHPNYDIQVQYPFQIRKRSNGRIMALSPMLIGYISCKIDGRKSYHHILIAEQFLVRPAGSTEIDHINHIRSDNRLDNLRWVSHSENQQNRSSYRGRRSEYIATLSADAIPYTHHNGFALKTGFWRDGNAFYRKVANGFRKIAAGPRHQKIHISLRFEDGRTCHIYLVA